jgi:hypothetical protein
MFGSLFNRKIRATKGPDVGPYRFATIAQRGNDWPAANARRDFHFQPVLIQGNGWAPLAQFSSIEPAVLSALGRLQIQLAQANGKVTASARKQPLIVDTSQGVRVIPS